MQEEETKQASVLLRNPVFARKKTEKRQERMSAHTERRLKGATSGEQALTPLHGGPWGTPHTQPHSVPISSAVCIGRWGGSQFPYPRGSTQVKHLSLAHCNHPWLPQPALSGPKVPFQTPLPPLVEHKAWVSAPI